MADITNSIDIVMRSYNDMPLVAETLEAIRSQSVQARLTVFDNSSTDGTREAVEKIADAVFDVPKGKYIPGKVLNRAMSETVSEIVVFVNSDCTPVDSRTGSKTCWPVLKTTKMARSRHSFHAKNHDPAAGHFS